MKKFIPFNINHHIKVKLSEKELQIWVDWKNQSHHIYPHIPLETIEDLKIRTSKEGYYDFQMHEYMEIFGNHINSLNTNILIEIEDEN